MTTFADFGFAEPILNAIAGEGYEHPTPIQMQAIPPAMQSLDILGLAQTGTGKTAAFALPLLHHLSERRIHAGARACRALILCPTRELAGQIADSLRTYGKFVGLSGALVYGGANIRKQIRSMERGVDILIATPGRLIDLMKQRAIRLDMVEHLILDEADQMLDMGFIKPIRLIVGEIPKARQTSLFSATMPKEIAHLAEELLTDPKRIQVAPLSSAAERVDQRLIMSSQVNKQQLLESICHEPEVKRAMIFVRTKHGAEKVLDKLEQQGMSVDAVHGNKSQNAREHALERFRKGHTRLLVCTDVAARGIDVDGVTHVFNFDLPDVPEAYVHRIGRTARAGAEGISISFCAPHERDNLRQIERLIKKSITKMDPANLMKAPRPAAPKPAEVQYDEDGETIFVETVGEASNTLSAPTNAHGDVIGVLRRTGPKEALYEPRNDPRRDGKFGARDGGREGGRGGRPGPRGGQYSNRDRSDDGDRRPRAGNFATGSVFNEGRPQQREENRFGARAPEAAERPAYVRPVADAGREERPRFDKPFHSKPREERSFQDRPRNDRPRDDRPRDDRSFADRPRDDRPRDDRPRGDRPQGDRPRAYEARSEAFGHRNGQGQRDYTPRKGPAPRGEARIEGRTDDRKAAKPVAGKKTFGGKPVSLGRSGARGGANVGRGGDSTFVPRRGRS